MTTRRYLDLDLPERFDLRVQAQDGTWLSQAISGAAEFERQSDGSYVCAPGHTLIVLRCVERHADHFVHANGDGELHRYRLVPLLDEHGGP